MSQCWSPENKIIVTFCQKERDFMDGGGVEAISHLDRECGCLHGDVGLEEDAGPVVR